MHICVFNKWLHALIDFCTMATFLVFYMPLRIFPDLTPPAALQYNLSFDWSIHLLIYPCGTPCTDCCKGCWSPNPIPFHWSWDLTEVPALENLYYIQVLFCPISISRVLMCLNLGVQRHLFSFYNWLPHWPISYRKWKAMPKGLHSILNVLYFKESLSMKVSKAMCKHLDAHAIPC